MSTERIEAQRQAARLNGAKSKGPTTDEGKAASSQNARKHGFSARKILIEDENQEEFEELLSEYCQSYHPANRAEHDLVREMAVYRFRLEKVWEHRAASFNLQRAVEHAQLHPGILNPDDELISAQAFLTLSRNGDTDSLDRHESHFSRLFNRAFRNLLQLQRHSRQQPKPATPPLQNEPEPERLVSLNDAIGGGLIPSLRPISVRRGGTIAVIAADDPDLDINEGITGEPPSHPPQDKAA